MQPATGDGEKAKQVESSPRRPTVQIDIANRAGLAMMMPAFAIAEAALMR